MSRQQIQNLAVSTLLFGAVFGAILFFIHIEGLGTAGKVIALAAAITIYAGLSVLLARRKDMEQQ